MKSWLRSDGATLASFSSSSIWCRPLMSVKILCCLFNLTEAGIDEVYFNEIVSLLKISEKLTQLPNQLSGGQQQRVAIARALASKPAIILADEPTGNLDSKTSQDVMAFLKASNQRFQQTMVMITHNPEIAQMADRIVRIEDGRIKEDAYHVSGKE